MNPRAIRNRLGLNQHDFWTRVGVTQSEAVAGWAMKARRAPVGSPWTPDAVAFLVVNYPRKGKVWCARQLGLQEHQVRSKASALQLKARGVSEAWQEKRRAHATMLTGRERPEQADVMRRSIVDKGLHLHDAETRARVGEKTRQRHATIGHPRGMLGKRHSAETRAALSAFQQQRADTQTQEQLRDRVRKAVRTRVERGIKPHPRRATWKAGWRTIGGQCCFFRSAWEANYARYLEVRRANGQIASWEHEPRSFVFDEIEDGCGSYRPDFLVTDLDGGEAFHEVKGWMDDRSKAAIRLMGRHYPRVPLVVIDSKAYKAIAATHAKAVPGWE